LPRLHRHQITSRNTIKVVVFVFDRSMPRTAVVSEHVAFILGTLYASVPMTIVTDCQAVFNLSKHERRMRLDYRAKMAGYTAQVDFDKVAQIIKVKSHCDRQLAEQLGQGHHHRGNALVDSIVGAARPYFERRELEDYLDAQAKRLKAYR